MKKVLIALVLLAHLISCKNYIDIEPVHLISVDINKSESLDISETADIVNIVNLELTDNSLIREISKIFLTDQFILIVDLIKSEIFVFNKSNGKFIRNIGQKGQGPGEHIMFNDVFFEKSSQLIYAHERIKRNMMIYNLSGDVINELPCKYWFRGFCKNKDGFWVYSCYPEENPEGYALMLLNDNLTERIEGFFPQKSFFQAVNGSRFINDINDIFYFTYPFSNVIYQLNEGKPQPYFQIDFGSKTLPYSKIHKMSDPVEYTDLTYNNDYLGDIVNPHIINNKFYFSFSQTTGGSVRYTTIYDLSKQAVRTFSGFKKYSPQIPSDIPFENITFTELIGADENLLIYSIIPDNLSNHDFSLIKNNIANSLDSESNPILFFIKESN
jgi:hypothetical protein